MVSSRFILSLCLGLPLWLALCAGSSAQTAGEEGQPRILAIYSDTSTLTANVGLAGGLRGVLDAALAPRYELYTEFRAVRQFPGQEQDAAFVEMLERKYDDSGVDVVLAFGPEALSLALDHRRRFAPEAPVLAAGVTARSFDVPLPSDVYVVQSFFDLDDTVALARHMQPDASRLQVFTGSSAFDAGWQQAARHALDDETGLRIDYVSGLTLSEFTEAAAALDPDTILLILTIFEDASGARFVPAEAAKTIAARSGAPSWSVYRTFIGGGVVGGTVETFEEIGRTLGGLALDVLAGDAPSRSIVPAERFAVIDLAELRRFGLDPGRVPQGAVLLNYNPTIWQRYGAVILAVLAVVLAQMATIAALVIQGRRQRAAQRQVAANRLELARLSRISQLGALSGAITHELNQPLTAIMADAEAGAILLARPSPDIEEVKVILADIAAEDRRAAKIIADLRTLMSHRSAEPKPVDLNAVANSVVRLTHSEAVMRGVRVFVRAAPGPLPALGDKEQFQQVVLNLMLNAMDAMAELPPEGRLLTVETAELPDGRRSITVLDSGPGLAKGMEGDPFQPFLTTKENGLGMGLAICRTIAEAHGGTLAFAPAEHGTRAVFTLPPV